MLRWRGVGYREGALIERVYLPAFVLLALLIGGSADKFGLGDALLMLAALPLVWRALSIWSGLPATPRLLLALPVLLVAVQELPGTAFLSSDTSGYAIALTRDIGRTLDSLAITLVALSIFLCTQAEPGTWRRLIAAIIVGAAVNMALALAQLATSSGFSISESLGYSMRAGLFDNRNHLASLIAISLPLAAFILPHRWTVVVWSAVALVLQLALGSDAGISLTVLAGACIAFASGGRTFRPILLAGLLAVVAAVAMLRGPALVAEFTGQISRLTLASDTFDGIALTLPLGSGFGTFAALYPQVEKPNRVVETVIDHAHNDYLELVAEGGLPALALIAAYFAFLASAGRRTMEAGAGHMALLAIGLVLSHSLVDYPLRTLGMLTTFAVLNGIVFAPLLQPSRRAAQRPAQAVTTSLPASCLRPMTLRVSTTSGARRPSAS